jgi:hypothetical protein
MCGWLPLGRCPHNTAVAFLQRTEVVRKEVILGAAAVGAASVRSVDTSVRASLAATRRSSLRRWRPASRAEKAIEKEVDADSK